MTAGMVKVLNERYVCEAGPPRAPFDQDCALPPTGPNAQSPEYQYVEHMIISNFIDQLLVPTSIPIIADSA